MSSNSAQLSIWVSGLDSPVDPIDVARFLSRIGDVHDVIVSPDGSDAALVVFKDIRSVQKALQLDGTNMRDAVITVGVPSKSQLTLLSEGGYRFDDDESHVSGVDRLKGWFEQLPPSDMVKLLQDLTHMTQIKQTTPAVNVTPKSASTPVSLPDPNNRPFSAGSPVVSLPSLITPRNIIANSTPGLVPVQQFPKIAFFSGDDYKAGEVKFWHWKSEVTSLLNEGYSQSAILQSIRRSLRCTAAEVMQNLKIPIRVQDVLDKFEIVFGTVLCNENLLSDYYNTMQNSSESVVAWSCRLESHLSRLSERGLASNVDEMLRTRFWHGLYGSKIKEALRHRFERGESYKDLFTSARSLEHEFSYVASNQSSPRDLSSNKQMFNPNTKINLQETSNFQKQLDALSNSWHPCKKIFLLCKRLSLTHYDQNQTRQTRIHPNLQNYVHSTHNQTTQTRIHPNLQNVSIVMKSHISFEIVPS